MVASCGQCLHGMSVIVQSVQVGQYKGTQASHAFDMWSVDSMVGFPGKDDDAASSVESESDAQESEEYQEDFEQEEGQAPAAAAAQKKNRLQSVGSGAAGRKV